MPGPPELRMSTLSGANSVHPCAAHRILMLLHGDSSAQLGNKTNLQFVYMGTPLCQQAIAGRANGTTKPGIMLQF